MELRNIKSLPRVYDFEEIVDPIQGPILKFVKTHFDQNGRHLMNPILIVTIGGSEEFYMDENTLDMMKEFLLAN